MGEALAASGEGEQWFLCLSQGWDMGGGTGVTVTAPGGSSVALGTREPHPSAQQGLEPLPSCLPVCDTSSFHLI